MTDSNHILSILFVLISVFSSASMQGQWTEEQKLLAHIPGYPLVLSEGDYAGKSVAIDGNFAIIGVPNSDANGIDSGIAIVYLWNGSEWIIDQALLPSEGEAGQHFGVSVSISGSTAIVGAYLDNDLGPNSGSAYIYERSEGTWVESSKLNSSDGTDGDQFGISVSISGTKAIVGAHFNDDLGSNSGSAYIYELSNGSWIESTKLTTSDGAASDFFGSTVSISNNKAIVGAHFNDDIGTNSGSAYIYELSEGSWSETIKLNASDAGTNDNFGISVSLSGDLAIVGSNGDDDLGFNAGAAYIYELSEGGWTESAKLSHSDGAAADFFGYSVSISGNKAMVGAYLDDDLGDSSGSAYMFELIEGNWIERAKLNASVGEESDYFGFSVAISGDKCIVGAYLDDEGGAGSGTAYIYELNKGSWIEKVKLSAPEGAVSDLFGYSVSISGQKAIIGAYADNNEKGLNAGAAYIFTLVDGIWVQSAKLTASDGQAQGYFGWSVSISGDRAIVGAYKNDVLDPSPGSAYIYELIDGSWVESLKLSASDGQATDFFGYSVSISGNRIIVGAYGDSAPAPKSGSAYMYELSEGTWEESSKLTASDGAAFDYFGWSVSISDSSAIVGAYADDEHGVSSGSAYVYELYGGNWTEHTKLTASDGESIDFFGWSVSINGDKVIVGAYGDDDQAPNAGSAYIYERIADVWVESAKLTSSDGTTDDNFGSSVAISGDNVIIGAYPDDDFGISSGSAYIFELSSGTWNQIDKLNATDGAADDRYGMSVSMDGSKAIVGCFLDDDQGMNSGSAYIYSQAECAAYAPADLYVEEINFGTDDPRVNASWLNPNNTSDCEVRGGRISPSSIANGIPQFANFTNTRVSTQNNGSTLLSDVALYNNPTIPFIIGQTYGYEVRCLCEDGSGYSNWSGITTESTFIVPSPPVGINDYEGSKVTSAMEKSPSNIKSNDNQNFMLVAAPRMITQAEAPIKRLTALSTKSIEASMINLFPNPTENELNISVESPASSNLDVMVYDMTGRVVITAQMSVVKGRNLMTVNVHNLESGMYVLSLGNVKQTFAKK